MLGYLHGNASGALFSVTAIALPSLREFGIDEISAGRDLDDHARLADGAVTSIAAPTGAILTVRRIAVHRHGDRDTALLDLSISPIARPGVAEQG